MLLEKLHRMLGKGDMREALLSGALGEGLLSANSSENPGEALLSESLLRTSAGGGGVSVSGGSGQGLLGDIGFVGRDERLGDIGLLGQPQTNNEARPSNQVNNDNVPNNEPNNETVPNNEANNETVPNNETRAARPHEMGGSGMTVGNENLASAGSVIIVDQSSNRVGPDNSVPMITPIVPMATPIAPVATSIPPVAMSIPPVATSITPMATSITSMTMSVASLGTNDLSASSTEMDDICESDVVAAVGTPASSPPTATKIASGNLRQEVIGTTLGDETSHFSTTSIEQHGKERDSLKVQIPPENKEEVEEEPDPNLCCLCDNPINVEFLPCGCKAICSECDQNRVKKCPTCSVSFYGRSTYC